MSLSQTRAVRTWIMTLLATLAVGSALAPSSLHSTGLSLAQTHVGEMQTHI
jgi:hypothetical protein